MWVVFLLAAMGFAVATLLVIYIGNKVVNAMKKMMQNWTRISIKKTQTKRRM